MKHPNNVPGSWYTTYPDDPNGEGCIACNICYTDLPKFFKDDEDGNAYVYRQPETPEETSEFQDIADTCAVGSIKKDGK
ncbi:MAG: ferredoxin [Bacteriovoracaceae bacterium]|nr:ferredoxin [Bacteriovoracaceae bacterium]